MTILIGGVFPEGYAMLAADRLANQNHLGAEGEFVSKIVRHPSLSLAISFSGVGTITSSSGSSYATDEIAKSIADLTAVLSVTAIHEERVSPVLQRFLRTAMDRHPDQISDPAGNLMDIAYAAVDIDGKVGLYRSSIHREGPSQYSSVGAFLFGIAPHVAEINAQLKSQPGGLFGHDGITVSQRAAHFRTVLHAFIEEDHRLKPGSPYIGGDVDVVAVFGNGVFAF